MSSLVLSSQESLRLAVYWFVLIALSFRSYMDFLKLSCCDISGYFLLLLAASVAHVSNA